MEQESKGREKTKKIAVNGLSNLEADIMNIVWQYRKITVREVHETMMEEGYIPYTTIMAAMNNMAKKGLLKQNRDGKAFIYAAAVSRDKVAKRMIDMVVGKILGGSSSPIIAHLLRLEKDEDVETILELKKKLYEQK